MKSILVFLLTVGALQSAEIYTYYDLVFSGEDWRPCCNTSFHSDEVFAQELADFAACDAKYPGNINCLATCFFNTHELLYDPPKAFFNVVAIKVSMGSASYPDNDWKTENADQIIDDCIAELEYSGVIGCNPNIRQFNNCYWNKMFQLCPADLKNQANCLY